jgi:hypothetical protein
MFDIGDLFVEKRGVEDDVRAGHVEETPLRLS